MDSSVSVVIPAYNMAGCVRAAIQSVRAQNWPRLEIIVVDDGSCDKTTAVLEELAAEDLHPFKQPHAGPSAARNKGIAEASGSWVAFLDADDSWSEGKLSMQMEALDRASSADFSYAETLLCDCSGKEQIRAPHLPGGRLFLGLLLGPQMATGTVVVRRSCFDRVGMFDVGLRMGEDWDMWLRLAGVSSGVYVPAPLLRVGLPPDDASKYPTDMLERCTLRVLDRLFARQETTDRWPKVAMQKRQLYAWHYSVLAKSYLKRGRRGDFFRLAGASLAAHPKGVYFLVRRWSKTGGWPELKGFD